MYDKELTAYDPNLLPIMLECVQHADNARKKELASMVHPRLGHRHKETGEMKAVRELLLTETVESGLVQAEVYKTILEGANPALCMREALPVVRTKANSLTWPYGEAGAYAGRVAEGAEIPGNNQDYSTQTFTVYKIGVRPDITNELIEDGLFDLVGAELRYAGKMMENKLNYDALNSVLDNSGGETDRAGSNLGLQALADVHGLVTAANFEPDTFILHPRAASVVLKQFIPTTSYYREGNTFLSGRLPDMFGCRVYVCGVVLTTTSNSYVWNYASDGQFGIICMDSTAAGGIAMRRDLTVKDYEDPIKDLKGMALTMRYATNYLHANATQRVEY
jgi:hypothetical protein